MHFRQLLQIKRKEICLGRSLESSFRAAKSQTFFIFFCKFYRSEVFAGKRHFYGTLGQSPVPIPAVLLRYQKIYVCNNLNHIDQNAIHKQSLHFFPVITINFIFINKITIFDHRASISHDILSEYRRKIQILILLIVYLILQIVASSKPLMIWIS